jgi:hypothetical protein
MRIFMPETVQGQVDEMWVDTSEPADIVTLADAEVVRELAMHDASARGVDHTDDLGDSHFPFLH